MAQQEDVVLAYIDAQEIEKQPQLRALHQLILKTIPHVSHGIKWGMPSYYLEKT